MRREAFEAYESVIRPFTLRRRPLVEERAAVLKLWAELIPVMAPPWPSTLGRIGPEDKFTTVFHSFAFDRTSSRLVSPQAESMTEGCASAPECCGQPEELDVCVAFLRFATLRKVIDVAASPRFMTAEDRRRLCTAVALAASRVACAPTREDHRVPCSRRGLPWFALDDEMESSDEDRDDGVPRPLDELLLTATEFLCGNWDATVPSHILHAATTRTDDGFIARGRGPAAAGKGATLEVATLKNALVILECAKVLLLRLLSLPLENTTGVPVALMSLVVRFAIAVHAALPRYLSPLSIVPGLCDIDPSSTTYTEMFQALDECCTTYTIKADGARFRAWCDAAALRPPLRSLHTSFFIFLMDCGRFAPQLEETRLRTIAAERRAVGSPLVLSRSTSLAEVLLVTLEHALARAHASSAGYVRIFPVRHGMASGYYISPTEQLVIALADLTRLELECRSELLMEEAFRRQDVELEEITGGTTVFPYRPAAVPREIVQRTGVMYESRKKILRFLDNVCPERYPILESWMRIAPLERYPELMACQRELMAAEPLNALLLRAATKEVHFRLEWQRVETHHRRKLIQQLADAIQHEFRRITEHLIEQESSSRALLVLQEAELLPRLRLVRCEASEASHILLHQVVAAAAVASTCAERGALTATNSDVMRKTGTDAAMARALWLTGEHRFPLFGQIVETIHNEFAQRERIEATAITAALGLLLVQEGTFRHVLVEQEACMTGLVECEYRALTTIHALHQSERCQREIVVRCLLAAASLSLLHAWRSCPRQHASMACAASRVAAARVAGAAVATSRATCTELTKYMGDFLQAAVDTLTAEATRRRALVYDAAAERQAALVDMQASLTFTRCGAEEAACRENICLQEQQASCVLREAIVRHELEVTHRVELRQLVGETTAGMAVADVQDLCARLGGVVAAEARHRATLEAQEASAFGHLGRECASRSRDLRWKRRQTSSSSYLGPQQGYSRIHAVDPYAIDSVEDSLPRDESSRTLLPSFLAESSTADLSPLSLHSIQSAIRVASHVMCMQREDDGYSGWSSRSSSVAGVSSQMTSQVPSRPDSVLTAHSVAFVLDIATTAGSPAAEKLVPHRPRTAKPRQFHSFSAALAYQDSPPRLSRRPHSAVTISRTSPLRSPAVLHEHEIVPAIDGDDTVFLMQ